ncbi:MAG TPA: TIR domain-containing protein [Syntrophales bacterium]|nr:TIR domain-containing protein [Syntrophales bacterium]
MHRQEPHVFISYLREDREDIDRICDALKRKDIQVWIDREKILPGERWQIAIRRAIEEGAYFLACFSDAYAKRETSYMNVELAIAVEQLALRPTDRAWFIPIVLKGGRVPDRPIGGGETLRDVQWVDLAEDWEEGLRRILTVLRPEAAHRKGAVEPEYAVILMTDIVGSSRISQGLDQDGFHRTIVDISLSLMESAAEHGGRQVASSGDGMVATFDSGTMALRCALAINRFVGSYKVNEEPLKIRIGLAEGKTFDTDKGFEQDAHHVAARICSAAGPGEIFCTESLGRLAASQNWEYRDRGWVSLKGFAEPTHIYEIIS